MSLQECLFQIETPVSVCHPANRTSPGHQVQGRFCKATSQIFGPLEDGSQVITQVKGPMSAKERCVDSSRFAGNTCSANLSVVYLPRWGRKTREVQAAPRHAATPTDHVPGCPERVVTPVTDTRPGMAVSKKG